MVNGPAIGTPVQAAPTDRVVPVWLPGRLSASKRGGGTTVKVLDPVAVCGALPATSGPAVTVSVCRPIWPETSAPFSIGAVVPPVVP